MVAIFLLDNELFSRLNFFSDSVIRQIINAVIPSLGGQVRCVLLQRWYFRRQENIVCTLKVSEMGDFHQRNSFIPLATSGSLKLSNWVETTWYLALHNRRGREVRLKGLANRDYFFWPEILFEVFSFNELRGQVFSFKLWEFVGYGGHVFDIRKKIDLRLENLSIYFFALKELVVNFAFVPLASNWSL